MKELTPLEELIDWSVNSNTTTINFVLKAKELLAKEKQVIIGSYASGYYKSRFDIFDEHTPHEYGIMFFENKYGK